jgi:AraC-like DNA-binding protein
MGFIPQTRIAAIQTFISTIDEGARRNKILKNCRIPLSKLEDVESPIPLAQAFCLLESCAREVGDELLGFHLGQYNTPDDLGLYGTLIKQSITLLQAVQRWPRLIRALNTGFIPHLRQDPDHNQFWYGVEYMGEYNAGYTHAEHFAIASTINQVRSVLGKDWKPHTIHLTSSSSPVFRKDSFFSDIKVRYNCDLSEFPIPNWALSKPFFSHFIQHRPQQSFPRLLDEYSKGGPSQDFVESVRDFISFYLPTCLPTIEESAEAAFSSVRTFQRRLAENGLTYKQLIDQVRFETATKLLVDPFIKVSDISANLGYSHPTHFIRAYKRWTGATPENHRMCLINGEPVKIASF